MSKVVTKRVELLNPVAPPEAQDLHLARRPASLAGKTVALFDDNEPNAREMLLDLAELLTVHEGIASIRYRNQINGEQYDIIAGKRVNIPDETLEETARKVDVALVGVGH